MNPMLRKASIELQNSQKPRNHPFLALNLWFRLLRMPRCHESANFAKMDKMETSPSLVYARRSTEEQIRLFSHYLLYQHNAWLRQMWVLCDSWLSKSFKIVESDNLAKKSEAGNMPLPLHVILLRGACARKPDFPLASAKNFHKSIARKMYVRFGGGKGIGRGRWPFWRKGPMRGEDRASKGWHRGLCVGLALFQIGM